jgi:hypothetical protein
MSFTETEAAVDTIKRPKKMREKINVTVSKVL